MATVTLSRGNTSVDIPLLESGSTPIYSLDLGKPHITTHGGGSADPIAQDRWSASINHTMAGKFVGSNAYSKAITLADMIKGDFGGDQMELSTPFSELPDPMTVGPLAGQETALTLSYPPGHRNHVEFQLQLTEVDTARGNADRTIETPTATGSGPIELSANGTTIPIEVDVSVERGVGRPNDSIFKTRRDLGRYTYKHKVTFDQLKLTFEQTRNTISVLRSIHDDIFRTKFGRGGPTLNFNGLYGLGSFTVLPIGSAPARYQRLAGRKGQVSLPTLDFRVINANP